MVLDLRERLQEVRMANTSLEMVIYVLIGSAKGANFYS
jgi:hypothetical protein